MLRGWERRRGGMAHTPMCVYVCVCCLAHLRREALRKCRVRCREVRKMRLDIGACRVGGACLSLLLTQQLAARRQPALGHRPQGLGCVGVGGCGCGGHPSYFSNDLLRHCVPLASRPQGLGCGGGCGCGGHYFTKIETLPALTKLDRLCVGCYWSCTLVVPCGL